MRSFAIQVFSGKHSGNLKHKGSDILLHGHHDFADLLV